MAFVLPLWKTIGRTGIGPQGTMTLNPNWGGVIELGGEARAAVLCVLRVASTVIIVSYSHVFETRFTSCN